MRFHRAYRKEAKELNVTLHADSLRELAHIAGKPLTALTLTEDSFVPDRRFGRFDPKYDRGIICSI